MEFEEITDKIKVHPGEYILHKPTQQIVLCGAYRPAEGKIKAIARGRLLEDKIENFEKIKLSSKEKRESKRGGCRKCGK